MEFKIGKLLPTIDELLDTIDDYEIDYKRTKLENGKYKRVGYIRLSASFDIEVSSFKNEDGEKRSLVYIWQLGINGNVIIGRTREELYEAIYKIKHRFNLDCESKILPIYVHNLSYEFQFFKDDFDWVSLFARDVRKPIKALTEEGIEFRCSYFLSGRSLEITCNEMLSKYKVEKKVGDLDYSLIRTPNTPLTEKEIGYCVYDVIGVMCFIQEQIEKYGSITKIPMTKTGIVRQYCREKCLEDEKVGKGYKKLISGLTINGEKEYKMLKKAFQGGFTHANYNHVKKTHLNVKSFDFTSSYPAVMVSEKFPMSKGIECEIKNIDELKINNCYSYIFNIEFNDIESKIDFEHYISISKCFNIEQPKIDNGRLISAKKIHTTITELDLDIILKTYNFSSYRIGNCYKYFKGYLPTPFVKSILKFYKDKTVLKGVEGKEDEYAQNKEMANSTFGMSVTDIVNDDIEYNYEWLKKSANVSECIDRYNKDMKRFLFYPWGVYITAYARYNLWRGILEFKDDYIYSDTDSLKVLNYKNHMPFIEKYNRFIINKLEKACDAHCIDYEYIKPKTIKNEEKPLGVWDDDGFYKKFKTLGAKRYLVQNEDDSIKCTVAGINKKKGSKYIAKQEDPFKFFDDEMVVPEGDSGRIVVTYLDEPFDGVVTDYKGQKYEYHENSGIYMEQGSYSLTMSDIYLALIGAKEEVYQ